MGVVDSDIGGGMLRRDMLSILHLGVGHRIALHPELGWHFGVPLGHTSLDLGIGLDLGVVPEFGGDFDLGTDLDLGGVPDFGGDFDLDHWEGTDLGPRNDLGNMGPFVGGHWEGIDLGLQGDFDVAGRNLSPGGVQNMSFGEGHIYLAFVED